MWQLGPDLDFTLADEASDGVEWQQFQHAPSVDGKDQYLLYDNGNLRPGTTVGDGDAPPYSRAVVFKVNHKSEIAKQVWQYITKDQSGTPVYADFVGDADRLSNGNVLIDNGGIIINDTTTDATSFALPRIRAHLVEVAPHGSDGAEIVFDVLVQDTRAGWLAYRAERMRSLYDLQPGS
jgi:hypothetical protein